MGAVARNALEVKIPHPLVYYFMKVVPSPILYITLKVMPSLGAAVLYHQCLMALDVLKIGNSAVARNRR